MPSVASDADCGFRLLCSVPAARRRLRTALRALRTAPRHRSTVRRHRSTALPHQPTARRRQRTAPLMWRQTHQQQQPQQQQVGEVGRGRAQGIAPLSPTLAQQVAHQATSVLLTMGTTCSWTECTWDAPFGRQCTCAAGCTCCA
jgi:hypothetical protein